MAFPLVTDLEGKKMVDPRDHSAKQDCPTGGLGKKVEILFQPKAEADAKHWDGDDDVSKQAA